ncbi:MAG: (deoxy)nucleoside triphosphate pyrophosphohydrolase [Bdellovibrionota bacterium]
MALKRPTWIPVVTGLLRKGEKVLVGQRPVGHTLAGHWEFPGGKIERNESPEVALARELNEELGIEAEVGKLMLASAHSYGDTGIVILFYEVLFWKGEPKAVHHMELKWVEPSELKALTLPDANRKIIDRIVQLL